MKNVPGTLIISIGVIIAVLIAASAYKYKYLAGETITVTGLAEKDFTSDEIVWSGNFTRTGTDLKSAYNALKEDENTIHRYLSSRGIPDLALVFSSVDIKRNFDNKMDENGRTIGSVFTGYTLTGTVTVRSKDIDKVERLSREVTNLLENGIEFSSTAPSYYYSKLNDLKIDLLAKAAADGKLRAQTIAKSSDVSLDGLKTASMGVFQITGKNLNEDYSYGGAFNTSSKEKTASITLKVEYQIK
jgi:hypothetical protein